MAKRHSDAHEHFDQHGEPVTDEGRRRAARFQMSSRNIDFSKGLSLKASWMRETATTPDELTNGPRHSS